MGLFSFLKNAGSNLFKKPTTPEVAKIELTKTQSLENEIKRLGIPISGLKIELGESVTVSGTTATNADREKIILALGNVECIAVVEDKITVTNPEPQAVFYTVQSGDSLSKISKTHYGDPMKYNLIFEANKPMLEHPDKIYPGQVLRVPPLV